MKYIQEKLNRVYFLKLLIITVPISLLGFFKWEANSYTTDTAWVFLQAAQVEGLGGSLHSTSPDQKGPITYQIYRLVLNIFDYDLMWIGLTVGTLICINIMFNVGLITFHKRGKNISLIIVGLLFLRLIFGPEGVTFHTFHLRLIGHTFLILIFFLLVRKKSKIIFFISGILFGFVSISVQSDIFFILTIFGYFYLYKITLKDQMYFYAGGLTTFLTISAFYFITNNFDEFWNYWFEYAIYYRQNYDAFAAEDLAFLDGVPFRPFFLTVYYFFSTNISLVMSESLSQYGVLSSFDILKNNDLTGLFNIIKILFFKLLWFYLPLYIAVKELRNVESPNNFKLLIIFWINSWIQVIFAGGLRYYLATAIPTFLLLTLYLSYKLELNKNYIKMSILVLLVSLSIIPGFREGIRAYSINFDDLSFNRYVENNLGNMSEGEQKLKEWLSNNSSESDTIYFWTNSPILYLNQKRITSVSVWRTERLIGNTYHGEKPFPRNIEKWKEDMKNKPPKYIVLENIPFLGGDLRDGRAEFEPLDNEIKNNYMLVESNMYFDIFQKK
tara:strand:- start:1023 stop:2687 length:1665 start_codon:yes stop_codon:yes gene_type:complete